MMQIRLIDRIFILLINFIDFVQSSILKNYPVFTFVVSHAPQKLGADLPR